MSHLLFWPTITYFYPVGNTSAVHLTENLSPESKADVLLLACGDPRHILYTIYADETNPLTCLRTFDITCCDVDVAILARNTLLFTLLADDGTLDKLDHLWNIFYHMFVNQTSLSMLFEQCRKLVSLAESAETWRAGPYGHFLTTCDARTLAGLRSIWTAYLDTSTFSSKQAKRLEQCFSDGMKEMAKKRAGGTTTAGRSAGPLVIHADQTISRQFRSYWTTGTTDDGVRGQGQKRHLNVNPTFAFSLHGDKFAVHYGTDPLCGFHLAEAFASGKFTRPQDRIPPHEVVRVAKDQFSRWCTSVSKRLKDNNPSSPTFVIRMFAGDALMFCQALKYCETTGSPFTPYNVAAWRLSTIALDDHSYGRNAVSPAPLSFDIIDTSNVMDHTGLVNLLVVTAPLLRKTSSATLYTEALLRTSDSPSQAILEHVCGDLPTMALLLGIIPSTFISQFTTRSNIFDKLMMDDSAKQYHERLAWKAIGFEEPRAQQGPDRGAAPTQRLDFPSKDLASLFLRVYMQMFSDEDMGSRFQHLPFLSPHGMLRSLHRSDVLHYNRRSFALLLHFVKTRVQTDWQSTMELFEGMVMADRRLLTGQHAYQELCCQLHLLGVYTTEWMSISALRTLCIEYEDGNARLFRDWTQSHIPQVVTLVLVVPREAIARLEPDFADVGTPMLQCDMQDEMRLNCFAVISVMFGSLRISGTGERQTGVIVEGDADSHVVVGADVDTTIPAIQPPWRSKAPLIVTFTVPSTSVMDFARNPGATVGLALRASPAVASKFTSRLGFDLTVFRTKLTDAERVFVLARTPVVGTTTNMGQDASASAVVSGQLQENIKQASYSEQPTSGSDISYGTSRDVHVQMNDTSSGIQSLTIRIEVTDPGAQAALADKQTVPAVNSSSGPTRSLSACLSIGTHTFPLQFPLPIDVARAKLRVARRSSYVEVIVPLASFDVRPERDLTNRFIPLSLTPDGDSTPTLGSIHRLNLDRCPMFEPPKGQSEFDWCNLHVNLMYSELEKKRARQGETGQPVVDRSTSTPSLDTFLDVKQTLHVILRSAAGATSDSKAARKVFAMCDTSRGGEPYCYIIDARMRLDVGSHTVVADAFVAPATPAVHVALAALHERRSRKPDDSAIRYIATDADETTAWYHLLPRLTERCRTWPHKTSCTYRTSKHQKQIGGEQTVGLWRGQSPLCACGAGVGTEILPKVLKQVAPYLTRAAFSPLFSIPYLKEVDVPVGDPITVTEKGTPLHDQNLEAEKKDAVGEVYRCRSCGKEGSLTCSQCKRARYCSKECQRVDWKNHKKACARSGSEQV